jgi:alpha-maltose-1-phosphate synthase
MSPEPYIVVSSPGRYHSFDLARELAARGLLAALFTGYPRRMAAVAGVPPGLVRPWPWLEAPLMAAARLPVRPPPRLLRAWRRAGFEALDRHAARHLPPSCRVVTALSASGLRTGRAAKRRGAAYVCDRGSAHIAVQGHLLAEEHRRVGLPWASIDPRVIDKELAEYDLADAITVPSAFAARSFAAEDRPVDRVHILRFGADLSAWRPDPAAARERERGAAGFRVLFAGELSARKGLHDLLAAWARAGLWRRPGGATLALAGPSAGPETDALLARYGPPGGAGVERLGLIRRPHLAREMSRAAVLVLPSIEDGFGLVVPQAMACGCPAIVSANTGAADIVTDGRDGWVVPIRDPDAIAERLVGLRDDPNLRAAMGAAALERARGVGGWDAYGDAAAALFARLAAGGQGGATPASTAAP